MSSDLTRIHVLQATSITVVKYIHLSVCWWSCQWCCRMYFIQDEPVNQTWTHTFSQWRKIQLLLIHTHRLHRFPGVSSPLSDHRDQLLTLSMEIRIHSWKLSAGDETSPTAYYPEERNYVRLDAREEPGVRWNSINMSILLTVRWVAYKTGKNEMNNKMPRVPAVNPQDTVLSPNRCPKNVFSPHKQCKIDTLGFFYCVLNVACHSLEWRKKWKNSPRHGSFGAGVRARKGITLFIKPVVSGNGR